MDKNSQANSHSKDMEKKRQKAYKHLLTTARKGMCWDVLLNA